MYDYGVTHPLMQGRGEISMYGYGDSYYKKPLYDEPKPLTKGETYRKMTGDKEVVSDGEDI